MAKAIAEHWLTSTEKLTDLIVVKKKENKAVQTQKRGISARKNSGGISISTRVDSRD
jgi:hypothetical protein